MNYYKPNILTLAYDFICAIYTILILRKVKLHENCVLVIMDPIEAYKRLYDERTIENINKLIENANKKNIKVILTRWIRTKPHDTYEIDAIDMKGHWSFYVPNNQTNMIKKINTKDTEIIEVRNTNAFMNKKFKEIIDDKKELILAGAWLESCIINTTRAALDENKVVSVVANSSTGHFPFCYISLINIQLMYGNVVNV